MDLRTFFMKSPDFAGTEDAAIFISKWAQKQFTQGAYLTQQESPEADEFILLDGCLTSTICDAQGTEICVGFYVAPCVVTPNIARTRAGASLVSICCTTDVTVARIDSDLLTNEMISSASVRNWANGVLRDALNAKADREWCLAALGGADRLAWFRETFPGYEQVFRHSLIASFLGVTPVTFSRLRAENKGR
jgi:CRP-like cAMP-binding protein